MTDIRALLPSKEVRQLAKPVPFSPGPWGLCAHLRHNDECSCRYRGGVWAADGEAIICEMGGTLETDGALFLPECDRDTMQANARLIAAAPDLYAALIEAKRAIWIGARDAWTLEDFKNWAVIQQIDAALDKARGVCTATSMPSEKPDVA